MVYSHAGTSLPGTVVEMSLGGMRMSTSYALPVGGKISVRLVTKKVLGPVCCQVVWCCQNKNGFACGLRFSDSQSNLSSSWVKPTLKELGFTPYLHRERRSLPRLNYRTELQCGTEEGALLGTGNSCDISLDGIQFSADFGARPGTVLTLTLNRGDYTPALKAKVVVRSWKRCPGGRKFRHGASFLEVDQETLERIVGSAQSL